LDEADLAEASRSNSGQQKSAHFGPVNLDAKNRGPEERRPGVPTISRHAMLRGGANEPEICGHCAPKHGKVTGETPPVWQIKLGRGKIQASDTQFAQFFRCRGDNLPLSSLTRPDPLLPASRSMSRWQNSVSTRRRNGGFFLTTSRLYCSLIMEFGIRDSGFGIRDSGVGGRW